MIPKHNRILFALILPIIFLLISGNVWATDKDKEFHRYYFAERTFYKYTADTLDEYFNFTSKPTAFAEVDWKKLNQTVVALVAEKTDQEENSEENKNEQVAQQPEEDPQPSNETEKYEPDVNKKELQQQEEAPINQEEFEAEVIRLSNNERVKYGLEPLKLDTELSEVAQEKTEDMAENHYFSHDSPSYGSPFDMMDSFGIDYYAAGENIAKGQQTPEQVVAAWMASEGHRANILHDDFTHIGVGYVANGDYWTQHFIKRIDDTVSQSAFEQQVVELTNQERARNGLSPLEVDSQLAGSARAKSLDMAKHDYFDHTSPTYGSPFDMMEAFGVTYQTAGENIARGQFTPEEVVQAWMDSDGHRANILNPDYTHIGVGFEKDEVIWTQQFIGK